MAQGNLQDAIEYSKKNPTSDFARQLKTRIETGAADQEAYDLGVDLSWAGRPAYEPAPVVEPGYGERVKGAMEGGADIAGESFKESASNIKDDFKTLVEGAGGNPFVEALRFFRFGGHVAGNVARTAAEVGLGSAKAAISPLTQVKAGDKTIGQHSADTATAAITAALEKGEETAPGMKEWWGGLDPEVQNGILDVVNTAGLLGGGKILDPKVPNVKTAVTAGKEMLGDVQKGATSLAELGSGTAERMTAKVGEIVNPTKSEADLQKIIQTRFEKGVKPLLPGKTTPTQARKYKDDIVTAVETIRDNKLNLKYADDGVDDIVEPITGRTPESLQQLSEALEQTKKRIFQDYDGLAKKAGEAGVKVDMNPIATELDTVINNQALKLTNPGAVQYAKRVKDRYAKIGKLDATTAQDVIQNYNKSLEAFYRNPSYENASNAAIDAMIANRIRQALDEGVSGLTGEQYQALKSQYGSLKSIERDVIKAALRDARKNTKGLIDYTDIFSGGQVVSGLLTLNPALIGSGAAQYGIKEFIKYLNSPNRAIKKMFEAAEELPAARSNLTPKPSPKGEGGGPSTQGTLEKMKQYFRDNPPSIGLATKSVVEPGGFSGFDDLSTKLLEQLKGRKTVSKQFVLDATNQAALKQPERDLIRALLKDEPDTVDVTAFANKVKSELLPLERSAVTTKSMSGRTHSRYENITLPDELRGSVANYSEHVYSSPIKTSAGDVHYSGVGLDDYFAHTRVEDVASRVGDKTEFDIIQGNYDKGVISKSTYNKAIKDLEKREGDLRNPQQRSSDTRRVIEIQSDLFQKGRLEKEIGFPKQIEDAYNGYFGHKKGTPVRADYEDVKEAASPALSGGKEEFDALMKKHANERVGQLEPYRNTWHERVIREEVKQAAIDGKTKLQFPTGETAMKIEGLGDNMTWLDPSARTGGVGIAPTAKAEGLEVGKELVQGNTNDRWIITDVLGDGKFKAVPKREIDDYMGEGFSSPDEMMDEIRDGRVPTDIAQAEEQFDISGKVDKENPIFKFYDKEVARYLKNKYGAKPVTDAQGVTWMEVPIKKEMAKQPIEAYAAIPFIQQDDE